MPELPEVETVCRALEKTIAGQAIAAVVTHRDGLRTPFPKDLKKRLEGRTITHVARRAKYILVHLKSHDVLVLHLGMSGRILLHPAGQHKEAAKHDHLVMMTKEGVQIVFHDPRRFGMAFIVRADELGSHPAFKFIGPEPLGNAFSGPVLAAALKGKKTSVKVALLDQKTVAGVGNIYACEALFYAGISPLKVAAQLTKAQAGNLAEAIKKVLLQAIQAGGSTLRDYRHTNGDLGYFQQKLAVYDKEGKSCPGCTCTVAETGGVQRITQGGRSTFYCPRRQG